MRRPIGLALIGFGAFLLTMAPMVRFYVADQVVAAPRNYYQEVRLEAKDARYFDQLTFKTRTGVKLSATNIIRGDTRAAADAANVAVWDSSTRIVDTELKKEIEIQNYRIAFDRHTSQLVDCCGTNVGGDTSVKMSGYGVLFPLANVEKRDYPVYDITARQPVPARFEGEEVVEGINTYRYVQQVPRTKVAVLDTKIPGRLLGLGRSTAPKEVDRYFTSVRTTWVDPRTGIPVKERQNIHSTLEGRDGRGKMTLAAAVLDTLPESEKYLVEIANDHATKFDVVQRQIPLGAVGGGLAFLLVGLLVVIVSRGDKPKKKRPEPAPTRPTRGPDGRFGGTSSAGGTGAGAGFTASSSAAPGLPSSGPSRR